MPPFHRSRSAVSNKLSPDLEELPIAAFSQAQSRVALLRPPSVVVSDHDLCQHGEQTYLTLEDMDADFNQYHHRRRFSDASDCSSLSFSELDFHIGPSPGDEDLDDTGCSNSRVRWIQSPRSVSLTYVKIRRKMRKSINRVVGLLASQTFKALFTPFHASGIKCTNS